MAPLGEQHLREAVRRVLVVVHYEDRDFWRSIASAGRAIFSSSARDLISHALALIAWTGLRSSWERMLRNSSSSISGACRQSRPIPASRR